jgi:phage tail tape-measure protein
MRWRSANVTPDTRRDEAVRLDDDPTVIDGTDYTGVGTAAGALGGVAVGAAAGAVAGPVTAVVGAAIGGAVGMVAGGLAGAAADNESVPPATDEPVTGNAGYGDDVDPGLLGLSPVTTDDRP